MPFNVQFTDTSTNNPTTWLWNFGDGTTSTVKNPLKTYNAAGTYTVSLTAGNAAGTNTVTKSGYILVSPASPTSVVMPVLYGNMYGGYTLTDKTWSSRIAGQANLIKNSGVDLAFMCELHEENNMDQYFLGELKKVDADWALARGDGGNQCLYRPSKYASVTTKNFMFTAGNRAYSDFLLQHKASGFQFNVAFTHFVANDSDGTDRTADRKAQATQFINYINANSAEFFMGDFNSATEAAGYPRAIFKASGVFTGLRERGSVVNGTRSTYSTSTTESGWIEDIFTKKATPITNSRLILTSGLSDHNGWLATTLTFAT